jgi:DNA-binding beta-propeller fold protein YncE
MKRFVKVISVLSVILLLSLDLMMVAKPAAKTECIAGCGNGPLGGLAKNARLIEPFGVAFDKGGNWYICEYKGHRVTKVDPSGIITLFAGKADATDAHATPAGQITFNEPHGLVITKSQQMYIADTRNHRVVKIDLKSGATAIVAGTGQLGYAGDGGPATKASFNQLYAVDLNKAGDKLYLTDLGNRRIRLLDLKTGIITAIAGNGQSGIPTDGADALSSPLVDPRATTIDSKGNLYILERRGNALRVVNREGKIRTLIGPANSSNPPRSASGIEREMNGPKHLCVDSADNVIIADSENHLIRKYDPKRGTTTVILGTGEKGDRLVADDPLKTQLNRPHGVFVHPSGSLYISDSDNHRVLKLTNW